MLAWTNGVLANPNRGQYRWKQTDHSSVCLSEHTQVSLRPCDFAKSRMSPFTKYWNRKENMTRHNVRCWAWVLCWSHLGSEHTNRIWIRRTYKIFLKASMKIILKDRKTLRNTKKNKKLKDNLYWKWWLLAHHLLENKVEANGLKRYDLATQSWPWRRMPASFWWAQETLRLFRTPQIRHLPEWVWAVLDEP